MSTHKWKESRFEPNGFYQGMYTVLQQWKCRSCGVTTELPLGTNPNDYDNTLCKEVTSAGVNSNKVHGLQQSHQLSAKDSNGPNRHEVRRLRSDSTMRSTDKS